VHVAPAHSSASSIDDGAVLIQSSLVSASEEVLAVASEGATKAALSSSRLRGQGQGTPGVYQSGEDVEIISLQGPNIGTWVHCQVTGQGEKPGTYNVYIPGAPQGQANIPSIPTQYLRKSKMESETQARQTEAESYAAQIKTQLAGAEAAKARAELNAKAAAKAEPKETAPSGGPDEKPSAGAQTLEGALKLPPGALAGALKQLPPGTLPQLPPWLTNVVGPTDDQKRLLDSMHRATALIKQMTANMTKRSKDEEDEAFKELEASQGLVTTTRLLHDAQWLWFHQWDNSEEAQAARSYAKEHNIKPSPPLSYLKAHNISTEEAGVSTTTAPPGGNSSAAQASRNSSMVAAEAHGSDTTKDSSRREAEESPSSSVAESAPSSSGKGRGSLAEGDHSRAAALHFRASAVVAAALCLAATAAV